MASVKKERRPNAIVRNLLTVAFLASMFSLIMGTGCALKKADFQKASKNLNETSFKVKSYENGKKLGIWTQTPDDYFKSEDEKNKKIVIYMAPQNRLYDVDVANKSEAEIPLEKINDFTIFSPQKVWDNYRTIPWKAASDRKWEATKDKVKYTAFFESSKNLLSKIVVKPKTGKSLTIEFKYSMIEEVPLTEYQLPSNTAPGGPSPEAPPVHN